MLLQKPIVSGRYTGYAFRHFVLPLDPHFRAAWDRCAPLPGSCARPHLWERTACPLACCCCPLPSCLGQAGVGAERHIKGGAGYSQPEPVPIPMHAPSIRAESCHQGCALDALRDMPPVWDLHGLTIDVNLQKCMKGLFAHIPAAAAAGCARWGARWRPSCRAPSIPTSCSSCSAMWTACRRPGEERPSPAGAGFRACRQLEAGFTRAAPSTSCSHKLQKKPCTCLRQHPLADQSPFHPDHRTSNSCPATNPDGASKQLSVLSWRTCVGLAWCASARACTEPAMSMQGGPAQGIHQAAPRVHRLYGGLARSAGADPR